jgi:hypothetical protein
LWVFKNFAEFISLRAKHLRRQLRRDFYSRDGSIFRNETNFVDTNARISRHRGF